MVSTSSIRFRGLIAPEGVPTGDGRLFAQSSLTHRRLPAPVMFSRKLSSRHADAVAVARLEGVEYHPGRGWVGSGTFLDPSVVPEVAEAVYLVREGISRPSVDLEPAMTWEVAPDPVDSSRGLLRRILAGTIMGFTFVPYTAFDEVEIEVTDESDALILASAGVTFAVNSSSWQSMPIAERETQFHFQAAVARLLEWSRGDAGNFRRAFLYQDTQSNPGDKASYYLPIADVVDGKLTLIPRAVFSAAAFLSGAHGGLPEIPEPEQERLRNVVTRIYEQLQRLYGDPRIVPPWLRGDSGQDRKQGAAGAEAETFDGGDMPNVTYTVDTETGQVTGTTDQATEATGAFQDGGDDKGADCPEGQKKDIDGNCVNTDEREPQEEEPGERRTSPRRYDAVTASGNIRPPAAWFDNPGLDRRTPLTVDANGRVFGHLASWDECHMGIGDRCITAPHSVTDYAYFKTGEVLCADGSTVQVGKITLGTGHADPALGLIPSVEHYDNTGAVVAVANAGEDRFGIWVAGSIVAGVDERRLAELRRSPLSGDWRRVNGNLELVAALAVNAPGFPVLRASAEEELETLLAAGVVTEPGDVDASENRARRWKRIEDVARTNRVKELLGG